MRSGGMSNAALATSVREAVQAPEFPICRSSPRTGMLILFSSPRDGRALRASRDVRVSGGAVGFAPETEQGDRFGGGSKGSGGDVASGALGRAPNVSGLRAGRRSDCLLPDPGRAGGDLRPVQFSRPPVPIRRIPCPRGGTRSSSSGARRRPGCRTPRPGSRGSGAGRGRTSRREHRDSRSPDQDLRRAA